MVMLFPESLNFMLAFSFRLILIQHDERKGSSKACVCVCAHMSAIRIQRFQINLSIAMVILTVLKEIQSPVLI